MSAPTDGLRTMQCMEVWGGNREVDNGVMMPGLDAWVFSRPAEIDHGGGDIHFVSSCATGRITRILVADISGHGSAVEALAARLNRHMRRYVNYVDERALAEALNHDFGSLTDDGRFATAVVATYWGPTRRMVICNAGHPPPLIFRKKSAQWQSSAVPSSTESTRIVNLPLGVLEETGYEQSGLRLAQNDRVLIYTDGLIEARNADGTMLTERGLIDLLAEIEGASASAFVATLRQTLRDRGYDIDDDLTILLLQPNQLRARVSIIGGFVAGIRVVGSVIRSVLTGRAIPMPEVNLTNMLGAFSWRANARRDRREREIS